MSTDMRGSTCCWTWKPKFQSYALIPHPLRMSGSNELLNTGFAKFRLLA